jgi:hypothetical protein
MESWSRERHSEDTTGAQGGIYSRSPTHTSTQCFLLVELEQATVYSSNNNNQEKKEFFESDHPKRNSAEMERFHLA